MKIGIVTLPLHNNYGGILQAYALQKVLQNMGHNATTIDKSRFVKLSPLRKLYTYSIHLVKKILFNKNLIIRWDVEHNKKANIICTHTYPFIQRYIKRIEAVHDYSNIQENDFDAFVVGSDQVWRPKYFGTDIISNAYLSFTKAWNVKRISYAASFGAEDWEYTPEQTKACGDLLKFFNAVSVRESSATELCKKHLGVDARHVLDPTMLLDKEDYINLFKAAETPESNGDLMCYILDTNEEKSKIISHTEESLGLKSFSANSKYEVPNAPVEERIQPPVESWLRGFHDAEFVITDSFHACVFSILFEKPFIVYGNKERGMARFSSLLKIFGLENRLAANHKEAEKIIKEPIDWEKVNAIKKEWQKKSFDFLKRNLQ